MLKDLSYGATAYLMKASRQFQKKLKIILDIPAPKTATKLKQYFLGMSNFYNRFIPKAIRLQIPLQDILGGALKTTLASAPLFVHPSLNTPLSVSSDA